LYGSFLTNSYSRKLVARQRFLFLNRDVRMAGYHGCTSFGSITNTLNNASSLQYDFTAGLKR